MSVNTETAPAQGQTAVLEKESVYASLFDKINLTPASRLGDINDFLDDAALSDAPAGERLTAAMQVFMDCIRQSGKTVEKLDKTLIDHHIADRYTGGFQLFASVCQPGTLNVTERFQIASGSPAQLQQIWSYLCLYMQGEPVPDEAVNKGRPDFWCPRKADKWPAEMERESTTAPDSELSALRACSELSDKTS